MDKENFSWGGIGFLAIFILLILAFFGRGNGFGWGHNEMPYGNPYGMGYGFQNYKAISDAEKAEIINTANTQYKVEQRAAATRELVQSTSNTTQAKIDFYAYQDLRDKLAESQRENLILQNKLFIKDELAPITSELSSIRCNMLRRPDVTGVGAVCPNAGIINGLGLTGLNNCCGCGTL